MAHVASGCPALVIGYRSAMAVAILQRRWCPGPRWRSGAARAGGRPRTGWVRHGARSSGSSEPSFFRSWGWIGCWLRHLPPGRQPLAAIATKGAEIVGLGVFVPVRQRRHWRPAGAHLAPAREWRACARSAVHRAQRTGRRSAPTRAPSGRRSLGLLPGAGHGTRCVLGGLERHAAELGIEAARAQRRPVIVRAAEARGASGPRGAAPFGAVGSQTPSAATRVTS